MPSTCRIKRLTAVIPTQRQAPSTMGLPPVFTSLMMLLFKPMAAMAITIKNLLNSLTGAKTAAGTCRRRATVVITDAAIK